MQIRQIPNAFAGEITDVDLRTIDDKTFKEIETAIYKYGVVVIRDQKLDNDTQADFARRFGDLDESVRMLRKDNKHRIKSSVIIDVSNLDENNNTRQKDDRRRLEMISNMVWHSDRSFRAERGALSMLFAYAVTPTGGETEFADLRGAYDALPQDMKDKIDNLRAEHIYAHSRSQMGFPEVTEDETKALPPVQHPLVTRHVSGRKSLYLGAHASHIVDWFVPDGRLLLHDLTAHATQRQFIYSHKWRVGDLVIWDNRVTLHRGRPYDESFPRDLRRVTTKDVPAQAQRVA
ncbi:MAG: TauD/TfdA family dioxygenase [Bauldia sp.]